MSKYVDEIIESLKTNPTHWKDYKGEGVEKGNIIVKGYGNTRILSVTNVYINDKWMPTSYIDNWKLEVAIMNWYRTVKLETLLVR